ncbi:hypothetical protein AB5N96_13045 [Chryseomicrobium imtechense]
METNQFEERMKRLKKGYEEMEERTDTKKVISALTNKEPERSKRPKKNWIVPLISVAAIFTLFLFAMSLVNPPTNSASEEEEREEVSESGLDFVYISQEIDRQYAEIREEARLKMGLEDQEFSQIQAVVNADQSRNFYMSSEAIEYHKENGFNEKQMINSAIVDLKRSFETPNEFLKRESADSKNVKAFISNSDYILYSYMWKLLEFEKVNSGTVLADLQIPEEDMKLFEEILHPKVFPLAEFYSYGKLTEAGEMIFPNDKTAETLIRVEESISEEDIAINDQSSRLANLLFLTLKGTLSESLENHKAELFEDGSIKLEVKKQWEILAAQPNTTVLHVVFSPIVKEMHESGWTSSKTWEAFTYADAQKFVLEMDRAKYETAQFIGEPVVVDAEFEQKIHSYFKEFALVLDADKYKSLSPEEIVGLYYYYQHMDEKELRHEMYVSGDKYMLVSLEEYQNWPSEQISNLSSFMKTLTFVDRGTNEFGEHTGLVEIELTEDAMNSYYTPMLTFQLIKTEDGWKIPFMPTQ